MAAKGSISVNELNVYEVDSDPSVDGLDAPQGSVAIYDNSGFWQKKGPLPTDWSPISLSEKAGSVPGPTFTGSPRRYTVAFVSPYPTTNYSVTISGSDGRTWVAENLTISGFDINAQAAQPLAGMVFWQAQYRGETI
jgi:hypothetical protein